MVMACTYISINQDCEETRIWTFNVALEHEAVEFARFLRRNQTNVSYYFDDSVAVCELINDHGGDR